MSKNYSVSWDQKNKKDSCPPSKHHETISASSKSEAVNKIKSRARNSNIIISNICAIEK